jgi:hypothetical protein
MNGPFWKLDPHQVETATAEAQSGLAELAKTFGPGGPAAAAAGSSRGGPATAAVAEGGGGGGEWEGRGQQVGPLAAVEEARARVAAFQAHVSCCFVSAVDWLGGWVAGAY